MVKRFLAFIVMTILILSLLMTGCSKPNTSSSSNKGNTSNEPNTPKQENVTLRFAWWGGEARHKATMDAIKEFEKKYPYIKVQAEYSGWDGYFDKLTTQLAGGTAPDVTQISVTNIGQFVARKQVVSLQKYIDDKIIDISQVPISMLDVGKYNNELYSIPTGISSPILYYNKDVFKKYGVQEPTNDWTWDDFLAAAKKITESARAEGNKNLWGTAPFMWGGMDIDFQLPLYERGGKMWNQDLTKVAFNSPEGLEVFNFDKQLQKEGISTPIEVSAGDPPGTDDFIVGNAAMILAVSAKVYNYEANVKFDFGMVRRPTGPKIKVYEVAPTMLYAITKDSKHPKEAAMLINYLINDMEAGKILQLQRGLPINKEILDALYPTMSAKAKEMVDVIKATESAHSDVKWEPSVATGEAIEDVYDQEWEAMMFGKKTPEKALADWADQSNKILDEFYKSIN